MPYASPYWDVHGVSRAYGPPSKKKGLCNLAHKLHGRDQHLITLLSGWQDTFSDDYSRDRIANSCRSPDIAITCSSTDSDAIFQALWLLFSVVRGRTRPIFIQNMPRRRLNDRNPTLALISFILAFSLPD
ncbi:hypothetical protein CBL_03129 [Carabus blaptoides fortunei]